MVLFQNKQGTNEKIITLLGAISLTATTSVAVVSCADKENWKYNEDGKLFYLQ
nr:lipoprotein [Entomoplasma sp. MP1]